MTAETPVSSSAAGAMAASVPPAEADGYPEALALYQAGRYREAAEAVQARTGPAAGAASLALAARCYANLGLLDQARTLCQEALEQDRLDAQNLYLLAVIQEQLGELDAAALSLRQALFIDADFLLAYFALVNLCRQAGDRRESQRNFKNALRLLERKDPRELIPGADGLTAGGLAQLIRTMTADRSKHERS